MTSHSNIIKATNKATGEVIELPANNLTEIVEAWKVAKEYEKAAKALTDQLKKLVPSYIHDNGKSTEVDGYIFRQSHTQRMTYDKAVVRQHLDEDTFDLMTEIKKTALDEYIKENLDKLGEASTILRKSMIPTGAAYTTTKLEKLDR